MAYVPINHIGDICLSECRRGGGVVSVSVNPRNGGMASVSVNHSDGGVAFVDIFLKHLPYPYVSS